MTNEQRLTGELVVHDYEDERVERDRVTPVGRSDVVAGEAPGRPAMARALRSISSRLRGVVGATTADSVVAHAAESAAASVDSLAQIIEEDGLQGIGERSIDYVRSNSKSVAATAAGLGLIAVEAWRRGGRRSRK